MSLRFKLGIVFIVAIVGLSVVAAQGEPQKIYLPLVVATPPALTVLVLQRADMPTNYTRSQPRYIENAEEANSYPDPAAALAAFEDQDRETSYAVTFSSQANAATGALTVADKVARYKSTEGAIAGQAFALAADLTRGYVQFPAAALGQSTIGISRTIPVSGSSRTLAQYLFSIQQDNYLALVQVIGYSDALDAEEAWAFGLKAALRLPNNPLALTPTITATLPPTETPTATATMTTTQGLRLLRR